MQKTKNEYETTVIVNSSIEDAQIESFVSHVQEIITSNGGEITATNRWGRKRLAYPIQKKNNGYYLNVEFTAPGALIARLEHLYILDENVLRFLTIQLDKRAIKARTLAPKPEAEAVPGAAGEVAPVALVADAPPQRKEPLFADEGTSAEEAKP